MLSSPLRWVMASIVYLCCSNMLIAADSPLFQSSGAQAPLPTAQTSFSDYVAINKAHIRDVLARDYFQVRETPFGAAYDIDSVVEMRAPYELKPAANCTEAGGGTGFLLTHGLTDSPYLLHDVAQSLRAQYPCALIRGLLLPGHGTVPGDTLSMTNEDWIAVTEYGVNSFRGEVEALYMVGFSTGTSLSVRYMDAHRDDSLVHGLIMYSPAIQARSGLAFLSPYLSWFRDWLSENSESDPARYESFSVNAGAQFYTLTKGLSRDEFEPLNVPVFMAGSGDDSTVNMEAAREFFCAKAPNDQSRMLWFRAEATDSAPQQLCPGLQVLQAASQEYRVVNLAHTSLSVSPENPHYGAEGLYRMCLHYGVDTTDYAQCVSDDAQTVYGETGLGEDGRYEGKLIRRGSFNPHYDETFAEVVSFIENTH